MCRLSLYAGRSVMCAVSPKTLKIFVLLTITQVLLTCCLTLTINKRGRPDIVDHHRNYGDGSCMCDEDRELVSFTKFPTAKTKIELRPLPLPCFLYDVIRISAPVINEQTIYYLHKPNGDAMKLDLKPPTLRQTEIGRDVQPVVARFYKQIKPVITQSNNYDAFSIDNNFGNKDIFSEKVKEMEQNEFMIGPLTIEDHGNWVLSIYTKDFNDDWIELFQVITVTITEYVILSPLRPVLNIGDTFNVSFEVPNLKLESCELVAPRSTFDRLYDRRKIDMDKCAFTVPNVTIQDTGEWRIIGVGKIVYIGDVFLTVVQDHTTTTTKPFLDNEINNT